MGLRTDVSVPIYDSNTVTTQASAAAATDITVPASAYYVIFTAVSGVYYIGQDGSASTTGVYMEQGAPGPSNFGVHVEPGTVIQVTSASSAVFNYTFFYNKL
tara:strand:+ start:1293 stop:1598 length:306 start_codon:yes stop_codon:yes gene_type:complete